MSFLKRSGQSQQQGAKSVDDSLVAIDIGTSKVRIISGTVKKDGQVEILGYSESKSRGVNKGAITDISELSAVLTEVIQQFNKNFSMNVQHCIVGIPGCFIKSQMQEGTATVQSGYVTIRDRNLAIENARAGTNLGEDEEIIHTLPQNYHTQTSEEVINPIGQYAKRLTVEAQIISCKRGHVANLNNVLSSVSSDIQVDSKIYNGIAAADAVLTESEKEIGVSLIDIGGGTVSVNVYDNKRMIFSFGFPSGGDGITQQIAKNMGISLDMAEQLKVQFGLADPGLIPQDKQNVRLKFKQSSMYQRDDDNSISYSQLSIIIHEELKQLFQRIIYTISDFASSNGKSLNLGAGFVLTGGVANTVGIEYVLEEVVRELYVSQDSAYPMNKIKVRIAQPLGLVGGQENSSIGGSSLLSPDKAVAVGLLRSGRSLIEEKIFYENNSEKQKKKSIIRSIRDWISHEF